MNSSNSMQVEQLVTVGVICYNAGAYIKETLDSIYNQTYKNIEVILSDDCSSDDTVKNAQEWFVSHSDRFVRTKLITSEKNTGASANGNRAIFQAQGEWYKSLDGDDILVPTAIEDYMCFVDGRPDVDFVFGLVATFRGDYKFAELQIKYPPYYKYLYDEKVTAKQQYNVLIRQFAGSGSSDFYRLSKLKELGGFDERFPLLEDHPYFIKLTKSGCKLWMIDKVTLHYRILSTSISNSITERAPIFTNNMKRQIVDYKYQFFRENYGVLWKLFLDYSLALSSLIIKHGNSYKIISCRLLLFLRRLTDPFIWYGRLFVAKSELKYQIKIFLNALNTH